MLGEKKIANIFISKSLVGKGGGGGGELDLRVKIIK
jgi:hypothetical protein